MTPAQIRLEAARLRQRADALIRLAKWLETDQGTPRERVLALSGDGVDAGTIAAILGLTRGHIDNIKAGLRQRGSLVRRGPKRFVAGGVR